MSEPRSCQQPALIPLLVNQADEPSFAKVRILVRLLLKNAGTHFGAGKTPCWTLQMQWKFQPLNYQMDNVEYLTGTFIISQPFDIPKIQSIATVHSLMHVTEQDLCAVNESWMIKEGIERKKPFE